MSSTLDSVVKTATEARRKVARTILIIGAVLLGSVFVISLSMAVALPASASWGRVGVGVTVFALFAASGVVGTLLGFLFGLPRNRLADKVDAQEGGGSAVKPLNSASRYLSNSNLTKVSDWLTTVVIGLGIANLNSLVGAVRDFGSALREPLGGAAYAGPLGVSIAVFGLLSGFVLCYVWVVTAGRALLEESELAFEVVPDLRKKSLGEAKKLLGGMYLMVAPTPKNAQDDGIVVAQNVDAGVLVREGTEIEVTVEAATASRSTDPLTTSAEVTMRFAQ